MPHQNPNAHRRQGLVRRRHSRGRRLQRDSRAHAQWTVPAGESDIAAIATRPIALGVLAVLLIAWLMQRAGVPGRTPG
jgi:hypothetical protein